MIRIRLSRVGKKKQPHYRVVVADKEAPRDGRIVERIGWYDPLREGDSFRIDEERALYWLSVGAQPSDAVRRLLKLQGTLGRLQRLHAGESLEALVAEYAGEPADEPERVKVRRPEPVAVATVAEAAPSDVSEEE